MKKIKHAMVIFEQWRKTMIYEDLPRGRARIASYVPTLPALRHLNCCTMAGWHRCNGQYRQAYKAGVSELFLIYTVDGAGKMETDGGEYTLCRDSVMLVLPHTPMRYYTDPQLGTWEFYWLDLVGERALSAAQKLWQEGHCFLRGVRSLGGAFAELLRAERSEPERSALIGQILDGIVTEAVFETGQGGSAVDRILRYVAEHYKERIDLRRMSERFYLSQNQIIRIVRARTGYTPHEYLIRFRLAKACELLQGTELPVGEIGRAVGYGNGSHFCAAFRRLFGITPAEYRAHFSG